MALWLKQSTAVTVKVGPFISDSDFKSAQTGLTISQADIRLSKNGGNIAQSNNAAGATHDELGQYDIPLDTTDTNTLGTLRVIIAESGALQVWQDFMVVPANVWDSLFGADKLQVHADEITAGLITAAAVATGAIDADTLAADAVNEIADGFLDRDMSTGTDSGSTTVRTPRQALRFLRNKWSVSAGTLTVTKENDSTTSWTSALTGTPGADPVTESDPAGP